MKKKDNWNLCLNAAVVQQHILDMTPPDRPRRVVFVGFRALVITAAICLFIGAEWAPWFR
jgi:hypothetical protein